MSEVKIKYKVENKVKWYPESEMKAEINKVLDEIVFEYAARIAQNNRFTLFTFEDYINSIRERYKGEDDG